MLISSPILERGIQVTAGERLSGGRFSWELELPFKMFHGVMITMRANNCTLIGSQANRGTSYLVLSHKKINKQTKPETNKNLVGLKGT